MRLKICKAFYAALLQYDTYYLFYIYNLTVDVENDWNIFKMIMANA